jgi:hypothetical protein
MLISRYSAINSCIPSPATRPKTMRPQLTHSRPSRLTSAAILSLACFAAPSALASCGAAFCSVNTTWTSESVALEPGSSIDLRYEYINQDQPRSGNNDVAVGQIPHHHDEVRTVNRNLLAAWNFNVDSNWGVSVTAPVVDREHEHIHNHHGGKIDERWSFTELGDVRVVGRYQFSDAGNPLAPVATGFNFGLKLPSGKFDLANGDGDKAERSLQPGSGTTDAIVGYFYHQQLASRGAGWFAQVQYQQAVNARQEYKSGSRTTVDIGYHHDVTNHLSAQLQMNLLQRARDSGNDAEPEDTGGRYAFLSPGLSYSVSAKTQLYGFIQLPLYQRVNGVQLTADKSLIVGISSRF